MGVTVKVDVSAMAAVPVDMSEPHNRRDSNTNNDITEFDARFINISKFLLI